MRDGASEGACLIVFVVEMGDPEAMANRVERGGDQVAEIVVGSAEFPGALMQQLAGVLNEFEQASVAQVKNQGAVGEEVLVRSSQDSLLVGTSSEVGERAEAAECQAEALVKCKGAGVGLDESYAVIQVGSTDSGAGTVEHGCGAVYASHRVAIGGKRNGKPPGSTADVEHW